MNMSTHESFMQKCVQLGAKAMQQGNAPVGSILVSNNTIIGHGIEAGSSGRDITRHAEIEAIREALKIQASIAGSVLYTTHEPCIMCSYVIRHYQIKTVVYGIEAKHVGGASSAFKILKTREIPNWGKPPELIKGVLAQSCIALSTTYNTLKIQ